MSKTGVLQREVRQTMLDAGGYWRPLAAVARLLEELGELAELLEAPHGRGQELAGELADLWIITTALADQFRIAVGDPQPDASDARISPGRLMIAAGPIGRVVNYYDGPKHPRAGEGLPSLTDSIAAFHGQLSLLSGALAVDLAGAVRAKLTVIRGRDMRRFSREEYDPSTAAVLALLPAHCDGKLWGSPELDRALSAPRQAALLAPSLRAFVRAAGPEGLTGYVIRAPAPPATRELEAWLDELLGALGEIEQGRAVEGLRPEASWTQLLDALPAPEGTSLVVLGDRRVGAGPGDDRLGPGDHGAIVE